MMMVPEALRFRVVRPSVRTFNHSTTLVPGRAAAAPGSATPELDSTHMNGRTDDKKRSVVPTAQSMHTCVRARAKAFSDSLAVDFSQFLPRDAMHPRH